MRISMMSHAVICGRLKNAVSCRIGMAGPSKGAGTGGRHIHEQ